MAGFYQYKPDTPNLEAELRGHLSPLSSDERSAALGLVAGMAPKVVIQYLNSEQAEAHWDLKYRDKLNKDIVALGMRIPLNKAAIAHIAKQVYVLRHTQMLSCLVQPILMTQLKIANLYDMDKDWQDIITLMESYRELAYKITNIGEMAAMPGEKKMSLINQIIADNLDKLKKPVSIQQYRDWLVSFVGYAENTVNFDPMGHYDETVMRTVISDTFFMKMLPARKADQAHDFPAGGFIEVIFHLLQTLGWDCHEQSEIKTPASEECTA